MDYRTISIGDVVGEFKALLGERQQVIVSGVIGLAALNLLSTLVGGRSMTIAALFAQVMLQCMITAQLLDEKDVPSMLRRNRTLLGAAILSGLAMLLGFILLIVPGLILMARWFLVAPLIVKDDMKVIAAMRSSWAATKRSQGVFIILSVIYVALLAMQMALSIAAARWTGLKSDSLYLAIPASFFDGVIVVGGWMAAVAAFNALDLSRSSLRTVFS